MISISRRWDDHENLIPALVGIWAAAIASVPEPRVKLLIAAPALFGAIAWWTLLKAERWVALFLLAAMLLPPLPAPMGNSGVHVAPVFALLGIVTGIIRPGEWRAWRGPVPLLLLALLAVLTGSTGFAALYSGWTVALGSLARVLLFGIGAYLFLYTLAGPRSVAWDPLRFTRVLFLAGACGALFACIDFYYQLHSPAGHGEQFIWVGQDVFRRAQGLFYEASTLGNFCAFFLVMVLVALFRPRGERPCSRLLLAMGGAVFAAALILSYSRASLLTIAVAGCAFVYVRRWPIRRALVAVCLSLGSAVLFVKMALPAVSSHYWTRLELSIQYLWSSPDGVLSGRISTWKTLLYFLLQQPWHALFGVGYKTLPYSNFTGATLIADNTYLSLLAETGLVGLITFLMLNIAILRTGLRCARSNQPRASFFGTWIFCFWTGEVVQMLSGDLITYWRVLPIYLWVLATAAREAS